MPVSYTPSVSPRKTQRRLKPEIAAKLAARRTKVRLENLYEKSVEELSPEEMALMRAAFFRS